MSIASKASMDDVRKAYDSAIATAGRLGFLQDRALGSERAGRYFLEKGDPSWASSFLSEARDLYTEWGADAKSKLLEQEFGWLLVSPSQVNQNGSFVKAKPRMKSMIDKVHEEQSPGVDRPAILSSTF